MSPLPILIPAAGASRRLGRPKQLEVVSGQPLLRAAAERALAAGLGPVHIVLGAHEDRCREVLTGLAVTLVPAPDWQEGMSAPLRAGIRSLPDTAAAALITLVDQWQLTPADLKGLAELHRRFPAEIIAAAYASTLGPPAIFPRGCFPDLLALTGDQGARKLLRADPGRIRALPMPHAEADYDTAPHPPPV